MTDAKRLEESARAALGGAGNERNKRRRRREKFARLADKMAAKLAHRPRAAAGAGKPNSKQRRTLREAKRRAGLVARLKEILS